MAKKSVANANVTKAPTGNNSSSVSNKTSSDFPRIARDSKARRPLIPEVLVADQIILYRNVLTESECKEIIGLFAPPSAQFKLEPSPAARKGEAQRTNYRFSTTSPEYAKQLFQLVQDEVKFWKSMFVDKELMPVGLSSNIRVYRYEPGDIFGAHYDDHSIDPHYGPSFGKSEWTLLFYLSGEEDGVKGGQTVFYRTHTIPKKKTEENTVVAPLLRGAALFHRHGKVSEMGIISASVY